MITRVTRRRALEQLGLTGAGLACGGIIRGQSRPILVNGVPVEVAVASVSPITVRISVLPIGGVGLPNDGALVTAAAGKPLARRREAFVPIRSGNLTVRFTADPPTIHIDGVAGRPVQKLTLDSSNANLSFLLPKGPLLGFGEGGPQFDKKGTIDRMRNGQGGYQLRTHGGRVPIQWLVGTDGWGLYIHQPIVSSPPQRQGEPAPSPVFDFTRAEGRMMPAGDSAPLDVFITSSSNPADIIREYARITGFAELPPLWTFGYMQSHRTLAGPEEVKRVATTFRDKKLPCDALIYLGTEFTPSGWNTRNGEFGWKPENFPEPKKTIDELHELHYKVVLHVVIEGRRMSGPSLIRVRRTRQCRADARQTIAGPTTEPFHATGRITSRSSTSMLTDSGRTRVTGSTRLRGWPGFACTGRVRSCTGRTSVRSRCIATATSACSVTARFSGRATSTRPGRR
jgi:alpha-glucosidase